MPHEVPNTGAYARKAAVNVLSAIAVMGFGTMAYLSILKGDLVQGFSEGFAGAIAALVALLARTESPTGEPVPVKVENTVDERVPTTEGPQEE
jgi:hypothetical protein